MDRIKTNCTQSLESVSLITIRRFARKAWRYMSLYQKGIGEKLAEYAVKKYRSHRRILDKVIEELNQIKFVFYAAKLKTDCLTTNKNHFT